MREDAAAGFAGDRAAEMAALVVAALAGVHEVEDAGLRHGGAPHAACAVVGSMTAVASVMRLTGNPDSFACSCTSASFGAR